MSDRFAADWLALREAADRDARAEALLTPLRAHLGERPLQITDLGAGTGANLRYLAPRLPGPQSWTLVDHDAELLSRARAPGPDVQVQCMAADLAATPLPGARAADLVTASALLDLVSQPWLDALAGACRQQASAVLLALSYDGTIHWQPGIPDDEMVRELVNCHQRRDKGFGPALGPEAGAAAEACFRAHGFTTWLRASPWSLPPARAPLQHALVEGWLHAAREQAPEQAPRLKAWARSRRDAVAAGTPSLRVGHVDLLALPPGPP
ncbi:class I SAM-dependent methyltransferase [Aquisalimonas lutea]|uniref:class I SAM-dependent methyltransferase n=1 Tax=Aquisalimonas lutea TaxID=1327750 RepID=UPI0025B301F8|nr:class I SAM-dependent methyltransferase [Aquisalimonas lutea]MDN3516210.1 class I SAM-dependent methyltransferase [Aquisalimonas lutea]